MRNYIRLESRKKNAEYAFFDLPEYKADHIFIQHKLPVKFLRDYGSTGYDYYIVLCRVKVEDAPVFEQCMEELHNAMLICGRRDYDAFCNEIVAMIEKGALDEY